TAPTPSYAKGGPRLAKVRGRPCQLEPTKELEIPSMTQPTPHPQQTALSLAASGVPVLPLRRGKVPFGNCPACAGNACGGRPNMKTPGTCRCPDVCHAWAAATTDPAVIVSPAWAAAWRRSVCVGYHPGVAGLTVVDL